MAESRSNPESKSISFSDLKEEKDKIAYIKNLLDDSEWEICKELYLQENLKPDNLNVIKDFLTANAANFSSHYNFVTLKTRIADVKAHRHITNKSFIKVRNSDYERTLFLFSLLSKTTFAIYQTLYNQSQLHPSNIVDILTTLKAFPKRFGSSKNYETVTEALERMIEGVDILKELNTTTPHIKNPNQIPEHIKSFFEDDIEYQLINQPVIGPSGHTYDIEAIKKYKGLCPNTRTELHHGNVRPNKLFIQLAEAFILNDEKQIDSLLRCPLTKEYFRDPVVARDGQTYERDALLKHLSDHNNLINNIAEDPKLIKTDYTNYFIKKLSAEYLKKKKLSPQDEKVDIKGIIKKVESESRNQESYLRNLDKVIPTLSDEDRKIWVIHLLRNANHHLLGNFGAFGFFTSHQHYETKPMVEAISKLVAGIKNPEGFYTVTSSQIKFPISGQIYIIKEHLDVFKHNISKKQVKDETLAHSTQRQQKVQP